MPLEAKNDKLYNTKATRSYRFYKLLPQRDTNQGLKFNMCIALQEAVGEMKANFDVPELVRQKAGIIPAEFHEIWTYINSLDYFSDPDYKVGLSCEGREGGRYKKRYFIHVHYRIIEDLEKLKGPSILLVKEIGLVGSRVFGEKELRGWFSRVFVCTCFGGWSRWDWGVSDGQMLLGFIATKTV